MVWLRRIGFFLLLNFTVMMMVSLIVSLFGIGPTMSAQGLNYGSLIAVCLIWGMAGSFISLLISRPMAKWTMGVKLVDPQTSHQDQQILLQTVHRLARSAGIQKMPEVGIYESPEVNAFATGATKNRSLVAVSSGLLQRMDRPAVEGVLGHEISHIANGDMVTMTLLQGVVNAFVMALSRIIAFAIDNFLRSRDERGQGLGYFAQIILVMVLQTILFIPGSIVIAAFSRYREYRADEGGAKLAGRGQMIGALQSLQRVAAINADPSIETPPAYAAFKITKSGASKFTEWFSSHPPLDQRIARLQGR